MIISRKHFDINKKCVIEKLVFKTPFRFGAVFSDDEACFLYLKEGESEFNSASEKLKLVDSESILLNCGNYFANLTHRIKTGTCEIYAVHLHLEILKEIYKTEAISIFSRSKSPVPTQKIPSQRIISHFIDTLDFYFENPTLVTPDLLVLKIKELILLLLQTNNAQSVSALLGQLFTPRQATIREVINTHLFSDFSVSELAQLAGQTLSTFKREFQNSFHNTPANYIKEQRLAKAMQLITHSSLSISEICYQTGFSDLSHFTRTFKQKYSKTPSYFRKKEK